MELLALGSTHQTAPFLHDSQVVLLKPCVFHEERKLVEDDDRLEAICGDARIFLLYQVGQEEDVIKFFLVEELGNVDIELEDRLQIE